MSFGDRLSLMPFEFEDFKYYCQNLLIPLSEINSLWAIHSTPNRDTNLRLSSVHFLHDDVNDDGSIVKKTILASKSSTKIGRGQSSKGRPSTIGLPCPSASTQDVRNDLRYCFMEQPNFGPKSGGRSSSRSSQSAKRVLTRENSPNVDESKDTSIDESVVSQEGQVTDIPALKKNRYGGPREGAGRRYVPAAYSFVGNPSNVITAIMEGNKHGQLCGGCLKHVSRDDTSYRGLAIMMRVTCEKGERCQYWTNGTNEYHSQNPIIMSDFLDSHNIKEISTNNKNIPKFEYEANLKMVVASGITPVLPKDK
jgi:hypothetical protein